MPRQNRCRVWYRDDTKEIVLVEVGPHVHSKRRPTMTEQDGTNIPLSSRRMKLPRGDAKRARHFLERFEMDGSRNRVKWRDNVPENERVVLEDDDE